MGVGLVRGLIRGLVRAWAPADDCITALYQIHIVLALYEYECCFPVSVHRADSVPLPPCPLSLLPFICPISVLDTNTPLGTNGAVSCALSSLNLAAYGPRCA